MAKREPVIEVIDDDMAEVLRRKTPAERLAATHAMWRVAYHRTLNTLRFQHPDWDEGQIRMEMNRRMLGSE